MTDVEEVASEGVPEPQPLTFRKFWSGEIPMPEAFWRFGVLYGTMFNVLVTLTALGLASAEVSPWACAAVFLLPVPYNVMAAIAVWRSASAWQGAPIWSQLARYGIVGWAVCASVF